MTKEELKYLIDAQMAIDELESFFPNGKKFQEFSNNTLLRRGVERNFEIIGESIKNYKKLNNIFEISHVKEIIGLRNIISHDYGVVDYPKLWAIFINHIPQLKKEIDSLIEKYDKHLGYKK